MVNTFKIAALPPNGHASTAEEILLIENVDVRVSRRRGTVVRVPVGAHEYVLERTRDTVQEGGTDHLTRSLANMPAKQAAASSSPNPSGRILATSNGRSIRSCPSKHAGGQTAGHRGHTRKSSSYRAQRRHSRFSRMGSRMIGWHYNPRRGDFWCFSIVNV